MSKLINAPYQISRIARRSPHSSVASARTLLTTATTKSSPTPPSPSLPKTSALLSPVSQSTPWPSPSSPRERRLTPHTRFLLYASSAATFAAISSPNSVMPNFSTLAMADASSPALTSADAAAAAVGVKTVNASSTIPDIVLYQFEVCPFCNKVRAYLDYNKIPYRVVEVDPLRKTELKQFSEDYRKVPIALVNNVQVNGSAAVIDAVNKILSVRVGGEGGEGSSDKAMTDAAMETERRWLDWLDNHLVHLIAPNIYRTVSESLQTFNYIADKAKFSAWERATIRYTGAMAMYMIGKKLKRRHNVENEREAMHAAVDAWMGGIREGGGDFVAGRATPGVADLSVYGVMKAIETFDTFDEVRDRNKEFARWFDRVREAIGESSQTADL